jgi:hypothetical protein
MENNQILFICHYSTITAKERRKMNTNNINNDYESDYEDDDDLLHIYRREGLPVPQSSSAMQVDQDDNHNQPTTSISDDVSDYDGEYSLDDPDIAWIYENGVTPPPSWAMQVDQEPQQQPSIAINNDQEPTTVTTSTDTTTSTTVTAPIKSTALKVNTFDCKVCGHHNVTPSIQCANCHINNTVDIETIDLMLQEDHEYHRLYYRVQEEQQQANMAEIAREKALCESTKYNQQAFKTLDALTDTSMRVEEYKAAFVYYQQSMQEMEAKLEEAQKEKASLEEKYSNEKTASADALDVFCDNDDRMVEARKKRDKLQHQLEAYRASKVCVIYLFLSLHIF